MVIETDMGWGVKGIVIDGNPNLAASRTGGEQRDWSEHYAVKLTEQNDCCLLKVDVIFAPLTLSELSLEVHWSHMVIESLKCA